MARLSDRFRGIFGVERKSSASATSTVGVGGTVITGGWIQPSELDNRLVGREKWRFYGDMLINTAIVAAGTRYFLNLLGRTSWSCEPANDSPKAKEMAELIEDMIYDMETSWARVTKQAALYRFYGFSIQEWTAKKRDDGYLGLLDIQMRPQKTIDLWDIDKNGRVIGVGQTDPAGGEVLYLPRSKIIYLCDDTLTDSPDGLGILRHLVEPTYRLTRYLQLEGWGYETDLRGVPVGKAPLTELSKLVDNKKISPSQQQQIVTALRSFIQSHVRNPESGLLLDSEHFRVLDGGQTPTSVPKWGIELLQAGQTSLPDLDRAIQRINHDMARILGVENLLLGSDGTGSLALSEDKTNSLFLQIDSALTDLEEAFNRDIVNTIWRLNGLDEDLKPWLKPASTQFKDVEKMANTLATLARAGAMLTPDDPALGEIRDYIGLSRPDPVSLVEDAALTTAGEEADLDAEANRLQREAEDKEADDGEPTDPADETVE